MPNTIGSLVIDLVANTANFSTQLTSARKAVEDFASDVKTIFGGLGSVFSLAGIADLTKNILEYGDELQKSAAKTGASVTALSQLSFAAKQVNIDLPELTSSFDKMEKSISTAATGTGTSKIAFEALGISLSTLKNLNPDQQFEAIANQISKLVDPADKARAAIEIFGRAGAELLPLFEKGAAGIEEARQKAVDFGASLDSDQVKKLADANTAVKDLGASFSALATTLVAKVAPGIKSFFDSITEVTTGNNIALLTREIAGLQAQLEYASAGDAGDPAIKELQGQIARAEIALQGAKLAKQIQDSLAAGSAFPDNTSAPGYLPDIKPIATASYKFDTGAMAKLFAQWDEDTKSGSEKLVDDTAVLQARLDALFEDIDINISTYYSRLTGKDNSQSLSQFFATNAAEIQASIQGTQKDLTQSFALMASESKTTSDAMKKDFDATANYAVQAGKSIQDSFAQAFDDIGTKGLGGLVADFVGAFRKILDQALAFDLAKALGITDAFKNQGSSSATGSIFSGLASLFGGGGGPSYAGVDPEIFGGGYATGGAFTVPGIGGTDSQMVKFKATPGERVTITTPGQQAQMNGITVVNHNYIDSRTDQSQIGHLIQQSTAYAINQSTARIADMVRRGRFAQ